MLELLPVCLIEDMQKPEEADVLNHWFQRDVFGLSGLIARVVCTFDQQSISKWANALDNTQVRLNVSNALIL